MEFLREVLSYDPRLLTQFFILAIVVYTMLKSHLGKRVAALETWQAEAQKELKLIPTIDQRTQDMFELIKTHYATPDSPVLRVAQVGADLIEGPAGEMIAREMERLKGRK